MNPKEYLNQIRHIDMDITSRQEEAVRLRSAITIKTSTLKESVIQESHGGSYDDKYMMLIGKSEEINEKVDELVDTKIKVSNEIDMIDDRLYRIILREKYLNLKTFEQIAELTKYDVRYIHKLHGKALNQFKHGMLGHVMSVE